MWNSIKKSAMEYSGVWFRRVKYLPPGADMFIDLKKNIIDLEIIFDVGGNVGQTVNRFREFYPKSIIYSFEPVAETFKVLKKNTADYSNVHCENIALGEERSEIEIILNDTLLSGKNTLNKDQMNKNPEARKQIVQVETIDNFAASRNIKRINMLKIDTEGWELSVIKGADRYIKNGSIDFLMCEVGFNRTNKQNTYFSDLNEYLIQYGYHLFSFYDYGHAKLKTGSQYANALFINCNLKQNV